MSIQPTPPSPYETHQAVYRIISQIHDPIHISKKDIEDAEASGVFYAYPHAERAEDD